MNDAVDRDVETGTPGGSFADRVGDIASRWLVAAIIAALVATVVHAVFLADALAQTAPAAVAPPAASPVFGIVQGLIGLAVVVAAIFGAGWVMKKIGPRGRATGIVQVVGGASVGPREKVVVVRFGDRTLLLGVAPGQVTLLQATDAVDAIEGGGTVPATPRFADRLRAARGAT